MLLIELGRGLLEAWRGPIELGKGRLELGLELGRGLTERVIGLIELGILLRINKARRIVLARVSGLVVITPHWLFLLRTGKEKKRKTTLLCDSSLRTNQKAQ